VKAPLITRAALVLVASALPLLAAEPRRPLMREFIGVNGHTVQFKPELYAPVCRLVRDYHPVEWDLAKKTSELPPFPFAKNRVDWNRVYGSWRQQGFTIDACLMFESVQRTNWANMAQDARAYGEAFAREFGPSGSRKLVESVEIGNEPGKWSDADYAQMLRAMGEGVRQGDPRLKIATCNLTTGKSGDYEKSVACITNALDLVDILNVHTYAQLENWPTWRRSFPEDTRLPKYLKDVEDLCRWRDQHSAGKPVWITEFGYDSSTKPAEKTGTFAKWVGVTDEQQAQWLVRSLLVFSAMPVERAYIYFFNDDDKPSLHASAGLTRHFKPKPSFHAVAHLHRSLGDYRFHSIIRNDSGVRVHEYRHESDGKRVWVAWTPTHDGAPAKVSLANPPGRVVRAERMPLADTLPEVKPVAAGSTLEVEVSGSPLYLFFGAP
jgi:hypothetical protein